VAHCPDPSPIHPREMRWSGHALTESEREVFPVPDGPITRSIESLIDNERGSERGVDDKGFAKGGVWGGRSACIDGIAACWQASPLQK